jgi:MtN3 and saliva related transmembrane protein
MVIHISNALGFVANVTSNLAFIPQIVKSVRRKKVDDVSIGMFVLLFATQLCWIAYAIPLHARQLWISSLTEIFLLLPMFFVWFLYRTPRRKKITSGKMDELNVPAVLNTLG